MYLHINMLILVVPCYILLWCYVLTYHMLLVYASHLKCLTYASCKAALLVLNYLSQHPAVCIRYSGSSLDLHVYSDSDWGSDKDTRWSTSGVLIKMAGGPDNWMSKLQPIVTVPSMEAVYLACFFAIQDVV